MKLSEAMRLGSMNKPQAFGALIRDGATCALGAAYEATGVLVCDDDDDKKGVVRFPILDAVSGCPACQFVHNEYIGFVITHLNDEHRWTRERIADWIETREQRIDATRASAAVGMSVLQPVAVTART